MRDKVFDFFDPDKARPRRGPDVGKDVTAEIAGAPDDKGPLTVSALVGRVKSALADAFPETVTVVGEISNYKHHTSGHLYFRLKDAGAAIDAVMFRGPAGKLKFTPQDGMEVVAEGRVDVYEVRGQLQFYVDRLTPRGEGALELAFRQLREKLEGEGLFDPAAKKPIPRFPRAIGVVSSATGAAVRDIRRTLRRRWPAATVYLVPSLVQGEEAAGQIAAAIEALDAAARQYSIDTILVSRGGGSLEDLWAFNEEAVARAIFAARTPIISGVGHEVDVTIADLVADVRAATPTAAAELAVPDAEEVRRAVAELDGRLRRSVTDDLAAARAEVDAVLRSVVFRDPSWRVRTQVQRLDELSHRLTASLRQSVLAGRRRLGPVASGLAALHPARLAERARGRLDRAAHRLAWALRGKAKRAGEDLTREAGRLEAVHPKIRHHLARQKVDAAARQLEALSYRNVLTRGFSVTRGSDGSIVRSAADAVAGERVETELVDGRFHSRVEQEQADSAPVQPKRKPPRKPRGDERTLFE